MSEEKKVPPEEFDYSTPVQAPHKTDAPRPDSGTKSGNSKADEALYRDKYCSVSLYRIDLSIESIKSNRSIQSIESIDHQIESIDRRR